MLKLKLQYFGHLMGKTDSLEKTLLLEKIEGMRRRGQQRNTKHDWKSLVLALGASESLLALIRGLVIYDQILELQLQHQSFQ